MERMKEEYCEIKEGRRAQRDEGELTSAKIPNSILILMYRYGGLKE